MADPKQSGVRLKQERIALPEEIDNGSICDEIVGSSAHREEVLSLAYKNAPTDATRIGYARNRDRARNLLRVPFTSDLADSHDLSSASTVLPFPATT